MLTRLRTRLTHLRTKLTLLYAGLFGLVMICMAGVLYFAISAHAMGTAYGELRATTSVFERLENLRMSQLRDSAQLAARDFGFRAAMGTRDKETVRTALKNVRARLNADFALMVFPGEGAVSDEARSNVRVSKQLLANLDENDEADGAIVLGGVAYRTSATAVYAPNPVGWLIVGSALDDSQMRALASLSAIRLNAELLVKSEQGKWSKTARSDPGAPQLPMAMIERSGSAARLDTGGALAVMAPIATADGSSVRLLLSYPTNEALGPFRTVLWLLLICGVIGLAVLIVASWFLARSITRPLASLEVAAQNVERGDYAKVTVEGADEIGRLARSFNLMVAAIEERTQAVTHLALHDRETDLPNREHFERALKSLPTRQGLYVGVIGVRRFEKIRDAIGYRLSGVLISEIAARLRHTNIAAGPARLSSDRVAVALWAEDDRRAELRLADAMKAVGSIVELEAQRVDVALIGGAARVEGDVSHAVELGGIALDQAHKLRRAAATFDALSYRDPTANLSLMGEMIAGLESGELYLAYQPKLTLRTGAIESVEALIRWRHPRRGMIAPDMFIPMAEETGHIRALTDWVLTKAIADQKVFKAAGEMLQVSVNISGRLVGDPSFTQMACQVLESAEAPLCFEITETALMEDPQRGLEQLALFVERGAIISIDDYGAGLSSLGYLKVLPAHELKIDRMFLSGQLTNARELFLLRSTIDLGHGLGMKVVAEGVEDAAILAMLGTMGCDYAQGYCISRPIELDQLITFLKARRDPVAPALTREAS